MVWHKTEKYPESNAYKWKSLLSNFDSLLWELGVRNFSWFSPLWPLFNMDTSLWQAVKVVLDLEILNFIKSLPLQWTHLWFWQLALLLPFPCYGVFTLVCVQSNYRINSTSGGHLIKVSKWEGADRKKKVLDLNMFCMPLNRCLKLRKLTLHTNCLFTLPEGIHFLTNLEVRAVIML